MTQRQDDAREREHKEDLRVYVDEQIASMRASIAANTQLTAEVKASVDTLKNATQPVIDAMKTMEAGIRTIGRIGNAGAKIGKFLLVMAAAWGAFKLLFTGASWADVYGSFLRAIGK